MKILECTISEELKKALTCRGIEDTECLLDPLYQEDLLDIKNNESDDIAKELGGFMKYVRYGDSKPNDGWEYGDNFFDSVITEG